MSTTGLRFSFKNAWDETLKLGTGVFHRAWNCVSVHSLHGATQLTVPLAAKVSSTGSGTATLHHTLYFM